RPAARRRQAPRLAGACPGGEGHPPPARSLIPDNVRNYLNLIVQGPSLTAVQAQELARLGGSSTLAQIKPRAWRIRKAAPSDEIAAYCEKARIDFAFIPEGRKFADLQLLAMDMDSTLITIECIDELGDMAGCKSEIAAITAQAMRGELDYPQSLRKRVALLRGLQETALMRVYDERLKLTPGADQLLAACKKYEVKL